MKKFLLSVSACLFATFNLKADPIINLNLLSPTSICATGNDSVSYSISASSIPANTNVVIYQSMDSTFNPYLNQGDSIAFIPGNSIPRDTINFGSCVKTLGIFIDACGASGKEGRNEYIILTSGNGIKVSNLGINFSSQNNTGGASNADINIGSNACSYKTPSATLINNLRVGSCNASNVIPASPTDSIPPNAIILCFTSDSVSANYSINGLCNLGYPIYVIQNACTRTIGAFTNDSRCDAPARYRSTFAVDKRLNCSDNFTYDLCNIFDLDGTYAIRQTGTDTARVSNNGIRINAIDSCGGIDYAQLNFSTDTILKFRISPNACNQGYFYLKAITHPNGTQPISNTIKYKLVCNNVNAIAQQRIVCSGDTTLINISSTNTNSIFNWSIGGTTTIQGAFAGSGNIIKQSLFNNNTIIDSVSYLINSTDGNCVERTSVNIVVNPSLKPKIDGKLILCNNQTTVLTVRGDYDSIRWSINETTASIDITQEGTYSVTVFKDGCSATTSETVTAVNVIINIDGNTEVCNNQPAVIRALGTFDSVRWSNGTFGSQATFVAAGSYSVTGYLNNCAVTYDFRITNCQAQECNPTIKGNFTFCQGDSTILDAGNGFASYAWNTGESTQTIKVKTAGKYIVNVTGNNCTGKDSIQVVVNELPQLRIDGINLICPNTQTNLTAIVQADSIRWNTGATTNVITISTPQTYTVTAYTNGCSNTASLQVLFQQVSSPFNLGNDTTFCQNESFILATGNIKTVWSNGEVGAHINVTTAGTYIATITEKCATLSDTITLTTTDCSGDIWLPNAFSPNGDGVNDVYMVRANTTVTIESFMIYNRWGNRVFEANNSVPNDATKGWDGTFKGEQAQAEVYGYHVVARFKDGSKKILKGNVTLLK
ncbi:MAG TPA: gliding motility-associated C-terminal domain-containing protein [Chitinophagales bacterium]|nr:gliding motility-associated C-terminal domain-containing protein [Chitinophagales bacterium]HQV79159.1 gliding motility-associated C-terminal domain-containing protein [Chitinophagales bacterium]HQW79885.1 gliding motility-associated C-terminal domain-containing protein [Chitinophagales bacterium]HRB67457.1 gliding motility-associated C-terminal domain-containing protein [Chitinophagales bacterium]HRB68729.1 gliding motility-associated C-terminal domain-containing protein [Chitinophagales ba